MLSMKKKILLKQKLFWSGAIILMFPLISIWSQDPGSKSPAIPSMQFIQVPGPNPILVPGESGWDSKVVEAADIIKDDDTYYLYYHAVGDESGYQIGVATADHPLGPWKKYENNPVLKVGPEGSWEEGHTACAFIHKEEKDKYYMWYSGYGKYDDEGDDNDWKWGIGLATASSPLGPWEKYESNPIMDHFGYVGGVVRHNDLYYLYTAHPIGSTGADYSPMSLAIAENPEGPYQPYENNPVLKPDSWGSWDDGGYSEAEVYYHDGLFHMFYGGAKLNPTRILSRESIGYAYSTDGMNFTKYHNNPVAVREMQPDGAAFAEVHAYQEGPLIYLFHTLRYNSRQGDEDLGVQVLATQKPFKVRMPVLSTDRIAPGKSTSLEDCRPLCLDHINSVALSIRCEFSSPPSSPVVIHVKSSFDGIIYDTADLYTFNVMPGNEKLFQQTFEMVSKVRYMKIVVENGDLTTVKDLSVYAILGG
jgi:hypothetical protein